MKKILIVFLSLILLMSCGPTLKTVVKENNLNNTEIVLGVSQKNQYEKNFSYEQFDSICKVDKISNNLDKKWHKIRLFNKHTGQELIQYLYIKNITNEQHIYRVQLTDYEDSLKITKRIEK